METRIFTDTAQPVKKQMPCTVKPNLFGSFLIHALYILLTTSICTLSLAQNQTPAVNKPSQTQETEKPDVVTPQTPQSGEKPAAPVNAQKPATTTEAAGTQSPADKKKSAEDEKRKAAEQKRVEYIEQTITFGTSTERKDSIRAISSIKDEAKKRKLAGIMIKNLENETDSGVIIVSCRTAADLGEHTAIPAITAFLDHDTEEVRIDAVYALKKLDARDRAPRLLEELKKQNFEKDSNYTEALLQTLAAFEVSTEFDYVKSVIEAPETSRNNRLALLLFIGNSKSIGSESYLRQLFEDENEDLTTRAYAVNAISKIGDTTATASISKIADDIDKYPVKKRAEYYDLYMHCISALVRLGDTAAYPKLERTLKSDNASMRLKAISLIKELKDQRAIEILKYKAKWDPNDKVRDEAKSVLKETFNIDTENKTADSDSTSQNTSTGTDEKENTR